MPAPRYLNGGEPPGSALAFSADAWMVALSDPRGDDVYLRQSFGAVRDVPKRPLLLHGLDRVTCPTSATSIGKRDTRGLAPMLSDLTASTIREYEVPRMRVVRRVIPPHRLVGHRGREFQHQDSRPRSIDTCNLPRVWNQFGGEARVVNTVARHTTPRVVLIRVCDGSRPARTVGKGLCDAHTRFECSVKRPWAVELQVGWNR